MTPYPPEFEFFWRLYPSRVAKKLAFQAWKKLKLSPFDQGVITGKLALQIEWRAAMVENGNWVPEWPHPATWLNQARWEDELAPVPQKPRTQQETNADYFAKRLAASRGYQETSGKSLPGSGVSKPAIPYTPGAPGENPASPDDPERDIPF